METSAPSRTRETPVLAGLVLFGVVAVVLGLGQVRRAIGPRQPRAADAAAAFQDPDAAERAALAGRDTDGDGIADLVELERTLTSPYLADSDSDGQSDKAELDAGKDPNCPTGRECGAIVRPDAAPEPKRGLDLPGVPTTDPAVRTPPAGTAAPGGAGGARSPSAGILGPLGAPTSPEGFGDIAGIIAALPKEPSAIRAMLLQQGMARAQLDAMDDATLLAAWQQVLATLETQLRSQAGVSPTPQP